MIREATRLIVTRSAVVEELRRRPKLVFSACRTSGWTNRWRPVRCVFLSRTNFCVPLRFRERYVFAHVFHAWEAALLDTEIFRMPFDE